MSLLDQIVKYKKEEVAFRKKMKPIIDLSTEAKKMKDQRSFYSLLQSDERFHFICEIKRASPSKGIIQDDFDPEKQALEYFKGGASAISVLTDRRYFMGSLGYVKLVRDSVQLPILRKDFIIDPYQVSETKAAGADILLLIARILSAAQIEEFGGLAQELELDVLVEIASPDDTQKINSFENKILGINNRNLDTFEVSLQNSIDLKSHLPQDVPVISESGIQTSADCRLLVQQGFRGALIGEVLMRSANPQEALKDFQKGLHHENET